MSQVYELRLPTDGVMVKIAELKPASMDGFPSSDLPSKCFDISSDYIRGDPLLQIMDKAVALDFVCEVRSEMDELEAFIQHLQNGDQQKGKAAEIIQMPNSQNQLFLVPQKPYENDGTLNVKFYFMKGSNDDSNKRAYHDDDEEEREQQRDRERDRPSNESQPSESTGYPVYVNGISEGYEKEVESLLDEYGELISFEIPKSVRDKCAKGEFRMLYAIGTFRNKAHAEEAIHGLTGKVVGPEGTFRRLRLKWDRPPPYAASAFGRDQGGGGYDPNYRGGYADYDDRWGGGKSGNDYGGGKGDNYYGGGKGGKGYGKGYDDYRGGKGYDDYRGGKGFDFRGPKGKGGKGYDRGKGGYDNAYGGGYEDRNTRRERSMSPSKDDDDNNPPPKRSRPWDNQKDDEKDDFGRRSHYSDDEEDGSRRARRNHDDDEDDDNERRRGEGRDDDKLGEVTREGGDGEKRNDSQSIFVRNIDFGLKERDISKHFEKEIGAVKSIELVRDPEGRSRGFGFIEFETLASKEEALKKMPGSVLEGRSLIVMAVEPKARKAYHERQEQYGSPSSRYDGKGGKGGGDPYYARDVFYGGNDYGGGKGGKGYGKGYDDYRGGKGYDDYRGGKGYDDYRGGRGKGGGKGYDRGKGYY